MKNKNVLFLTQAALIAAVYVVLTVVFAPFGFGEVQVRISEMLTILPIFTAAAIPGLFIGCIIGNILGGAIVADIVFGSLATLIGAVGTYLIGKAIAGRKPRSLKSMIFAVLPPIIANAVIVPFVLKYGYGIELPIPIMMLTVGAGEIISCGVLGITLAKLVEGHENNLFGK